MHNYNQFILKRKNEITYLELAVRQSRWSIGWAEVLSGLMLIGLMEVMVCPLKALNRQ